MEDDSQKAAGVQQAADKNSPMRRSTEEGVMTRGERTVIIVLDQAQAAFAAGRVRAAWQAARDDDRHMQFYARLETRCVAGEHRLVAEELEALYLLAIGNLDEATWTPEQRALVYQLNDHLIAEAPNAQE